MNTTCDVGIVGDGPAAFAAALTLQDLGANVCIIGRRSDSKVHIGETVPAAARTVFALLGLSGELDEPAHLAVCEHRSSWADAAVRIRQSIANPYGGSIVVDRNALLGRARARFLARRGKELAATVTAITRSGSLRVRAERDALTVECQALVDASGRGAIAARRLGASRQRHSAQLSVGVEYEVRRGESLEATTVIESRPEGWLYAAAVDRGHAVVWWTCELSPGAAPRQRSQVMRHIQDSVATWDWIRSAGLMATSRVHVRDSSVGSLDVFAGDRWAAAGDAAMTLDPLCGRGITFGVTSGIHAGKAIAQCLAGDARALDAYAGTMNSVARTHLELRRDFYGKEGRWRSGPFWQART